MLKTPVGSLLPCESIEEEGESGKDSASSPPYKSASPFFKHVHDEHQPSPSLFSLDSSIEATDALIMFALNPRRRPHWSLR